MKAKKKALITDITSAVEAKLNESGKQSKKAKKAVEKAAEKLADKLAKVFKKEENKAKKEENKAKKKGKAGSKKGDKKAKEQSTPTAAAPAADIKSAAPKTAKAPKPASVAESDSAPILVPADVPAK